MRLFRFFHVLSATKLMSLRYSLGGQWTGKFMFGLINHFIVG